MKKEFVYYLFYIMFILPINLLIAQVGINTSSPLGIFHIDPLRNNDSEINFSEFDSRLADDFIISNNGNIALGMLPSQNAKLSINGKLRIFDGSEGDGLFFISNSNGLGKWTHVTLGDKVGLWTIGPTIINFTGENQLIEGVSEIGVNYIGLTNGINSLVVPAGEYLMMVNADIGGSEAAQLSIVKQNTGEVISSSSYLEYLSGVVVYLLLTEVTPLSLKCKVLDIGSPYLIPPYSARFEAVLTFLKLE